MDCVERRAPRDVREAIAAETLSTKADVAAGAGVAERGEEEVEAEEGFADVCDGVGGFAVEGVAGGEGGEVGEGAVENEGEEEE